MSEKIEGGLPPNEKQEEENERKALVEYGTDILEQRGIDLEQYRQYFGTMFDNDAPVVNHLPNFDFLKYGVGTVDEAIESWNLIQSIYEKINFEKLDEATGKAILEKIKILVSELAAELRKWKQIVDANPGAISSPSEKLVDLKRQIGELAEEYGSLPAYIAYRWVGQYEIDPDTVPKDKWFRYRGTVKEE